jgi:hypothetical protein
LTSAESAKICAEMLVVPTRSVVPENVTEKSAPAAMVMKVQVVVVGS